VAQTISAEAVPNNRNYMTATIRCVITWYFAYLSCHAAHAAFSCQENGGCDLDDDTTVLLQTNRAKVSLAPMRTSKADDTIEAMIVEPRCHGALPLVVWNMHTQLPKLRIQLFYSEGNEACITGWFSKKENMTLTKLGPEFWLGSQSKRDISYLLSNSHFWDKVQAKKVLYFQQDSWVCNNAEPKLQSFLSYDWIGAPWPHGQVPGCNGVGNGGFSLRSVDAMKQVTKKYGQTETAEDVYFCRHLEDDNENWSFDAGIANRTAANEFSAEQLPPEQNHEHQTFGLHQVWNFGWYEKDAALRRNCPGVSILHNANQQDWTSLSASNLTAAVELGEQFVRTAEAGTKQNNESTQGVAAGDWTSYLAALQTETESGHGRVFAVTMSRHESARKAQTSKDVAGLVASGRMAA